MDLNDYFRTEKQCINYYTKLRWNGKITCPFKHCKANGCEKNKIYKLKSGKDFKCASCGKIFSYKVGSIFENSKISMKKWFLAIYLHTAHKKELMYWADASFNKKKPEQSTEKVIIETLDKKPKKIKPLKEKSIEKKDFDKFLKKTFTGKSIEK